MFPVDINRKEKKATLTFNSEFYDQYYITEVCERFSDISKIKLVFDRDKKRITAEITPKGNDDIEEVAYQFANWALHLQAKGV